VASEGQVGAVQRHLVEMEDEPDGEAPADHAHQEICGVQVRDSEPGSNARPQGYAQTDADTVHSILIIGRSADYCQPAGYGTRAGAAYRAEIAKQIHWSESTC
jgi:hypothetical protein